jgi:hypothetical protein
MRLSAQGVETRGIKTMGAIIWLASYPKSGNTWTRALLHNLLVNEDEPIDINRLNSFCLGESKGEYYSQLDQRPLTEISDREIAELRLKVHKSLTFASPDSVFVKTHNYLGEWEGVPLVNMEVTAGAIYVLRNPLDVVISFSHHFGVGLDDAITQMAHLEMGTPTTANNVRQVYGSWSSNVKSWTGDPNPGIHVVRYEDLTAKPLQTVTAMARFLGLNPPRDRIQRTIDNSSFKVLKSQEEKHGFVERSAFARFFRAGKTGQWRDVLTPEQVGLMVEAHREQMQKFGYVPKGY